MATKKPAETPAWPADAVERWPIEKLKPNERNARKHSAAQVKSIAEAIKQWGFTTAVLVDRDGSIIAGHGRVLAAKKLKLTEIPVMVARGWSEAQKRAYLVADNKLGLNSDWDLDLPGEQLTELKRSTSTPTWSASVPTSSRSYCRARSRPQRRISAPPDAPQNL
jgi:ParB-like chromosome segregation protein Spo0J